jgi:hypothetical protein
MTESWWEQGEGSTDPGRDQRIRWTHRTTRRLEVWPREMRAPAYTPDPGTFPATYIPAGVECAWMGETPVWVVFYAAPDGHLQQFHARSTEWAEGTEAITEDGSQ